MASPTANLPHLTVDMPGSGGVLKARPEDFLVEELPLYEPCGEGEHLMLFVEKRKLTTSDVVRRLAKAFKVKPTSIGFAGMKDKHAVTRQHFTVHRPDPAEDAALLSRMEHMPFAVLWAERHANKLKRGHLRGNRFVIYVREVDPATVLRAQPILQALQKRGIPNFLGEQRFGYRMNNHLVGKHLLLKEWDAVLDAMFVQNANTLSPWAQAAAEAYQQGDHLETLNVWPKGLRHERQALDLLRQGKNKQTAAMSVGKRQLDFVISGFQSEVFNRVLARRMEDSTMDRLLPGDLAWKHDSRAVFAVDEAIAEQENAPDGRASGFEVSPSGPMWGQAMTRAQGVVGDLEQAALEATGVSLAKLEAVDHVKIEGARRPLRVKLSNVDLSGGADEHGPYLRTAFDLPRGSFATIVMREVMKNELSISGDEGD